MLKWLKELSGRVVAVLFALLFMQTPSFMQHYVVQLDARIHELEWQTESIKRSATFAGKDETALIEKFINNEDPDIKFQGKLIEQLFTRYHRLQGLLQSLDNSPPWTKPFVFMQSIDLEICRVAWARFYWSFNLTLETLAYGFIGVLTASFIYSLSIAFVRFLISSITKTFSLFVAKIRC